MKFLAEIEILPKKGLLDPQGKAVTQSMPRIGLNQVKEVRVGRFITMEFEANDKAQAEADANTACKNLLANLTLSAFQISLS